MAEQDAGGRGIAETFKHKLGPLPVGVWIVGVVLVWYVVVKRRGSATATPGQQTDPAGNVGTINPRTGYVYGSSQDQSALAGQSAGGASGSGSGGSGATVAGQYTTNQDWARAAINLLVGQGIDPTEANTAIEQYISSQQLSSQQQADVNLAIQSLGAPPDPPQPGGNPQPIVTPPSPGPVYATNPATGLATSGVTASTISLKWNRSTNATGYTITASSSSKPTVSTTVSSTDASGTVSGLSENTLYTVKVQATPARPGDGYASLNVMTSKGQTQPVPSPVGPGSGPTVLPPAPTGGGTTTVTVVKWAPAPNTPWNSTLSGIAAHYHTTVSKLMQLNPGITNENLIYPGQQVKVPTS